jgi:hypothetical protein
MENNMFKVENDMPLQRMSGNRRNDKLRDLVDVLKGLNKGQSVYISEEHQEKFSLRQPNVRRFLNSIGIGKLFAFRTVKDAPDYANGYRIYRLDK